MDNRYDDLREEINSLKEVIGYQTTIINKMLLMINLSNSDLKNYLHILEET